MAKNIVYIQANDKIAESFRETFAEREIDLVIAKSAAEAIKIMMAREVDVLLVDINIPDMRLSKLVEICTKNFPGVILNVCVDVMNSLLVTKLVNRHGIRKIFVAPWDVSEMVEEIEESLDAAQIARDQKIYENKILTENEHFEETLSSLTQSLKKQQYSYNTLKKITDVLLNDITLFNEKIDENHKNLFKMIIDRFIRMQTTDSIDIDKFEDIIKDDMNKITKAYSGFKCTDILSCLIGGVPKAQAANIRFFIWLIALYSAYTRKSCEYVVESQLLSVSKALFTLSVSGKITKPDDLFQKYVFSLLNNLCEVIEIQNQDDNSTYNIEFMTLSDEFTE